MSDSAFGRILGSSWSPFDQRPFMGDSGNASLKGMSKQEILALGQALNQSCQQQARQATLIDDLRQSTHAQRRAALVRDLQQFQQFRGRLSNAIPPRWREVVDMGFDSPEDPEEVGCA